jgi:hypothetical protein
MKPKDCDHQTADTEWTDQVEFYNYCPWCGKKLNPIEKEEEDDCVKGGCAD